MSLIGPVLLEEKKENARANLKDQLATLKDEEWDLHGCVSVGRSCDPRWIRRGGVMTDW